jgi:hypothetical protein
MKDALLPDLSYNTSVMKNEVTLGHLGKVTQLRHSNDQIIGENMKVKEVRDTD